MEAAYLSQGVEVDKVSNSAILIVRGEITMLLCMNNN